MTAVAIFSRELPNDEVSDNLDFMNKYIEITPEMIAAGVDRLRDFHHGEPWERVLEHVFIAMYLEKQG